MTFSIKKRDSAEFPSVLVVKDLALSLLRLGSVPGQGTSAWHGCGQKKKKKKKEMALFCSFLWLSSIPLLCVNIRQNEPIYRKEANSGTWRTDLWWSRGEGEGVEWTGSLGLEDADYCIWSGWVMKTCSIAQRTVTNQL